MSEALRALLLIPLVLLPAALACSRHAGRGLTGAERLLVGLALAPCALGLAGALGLAAGAPLPIALAIAEAIAIAAAVWPRRRAEQASERSDFPGASVLTVTVALALLIVAVPLLRPYILVWSDAWFHSAAAIEVARHGIPPQDPGYAGVPFYYPWFHHVVLALLAGAAGVSAFHAQALFNAWAVVVLGLGAALLAGRCFGRAAASLAAPIAILGLNPLGWLLWLVPALVGETRGWGSVLSGLGDANATLYSLSRAFVGPLAVQFPYIHASLLDRFWTGTALTPAIALAAALAWSTVRALDGGGRGIGAARTFLIAAALLALHPAFGVMSVAAVGGGLLLASLTAARGTALVQLGILTVAVALAVPWVRACSPPGASALPAPGFYAPNAWSLAIAIGPWWLIAAPAIAAALRGGGPTLRVGAPARFAAGALAASAVLALGLVMTRTNSEKIAYLVWVLVAPFAAAGLQQWGDRLRLSAPWRLALLAALILPTSLACAFGFVGDPRSPRSLLFGDAADDRRPIVATAEEAEAHRFLDGLPADVVIIESPRPTINEPVPVLARHRVFAGALETYLENHYGRDPGSVAAARPLMEDLARRRGIQRTLFAGAALDSAQRGYLDRFSAPLVLLWRRTEHPPAAEAALAARPEWARAWENAALAVYRYRPAP